MSIFQKIVHWYFSKSALPYWGIVLLDCMAIFISGIFVGITTDGPEATILQWDALSISMVANLCCYIVGMRMLHTYSGVMRYSSFVDLQRVGVANLIGAVLTYPIREFVLERYGLAVLGYYDLFAIFLIATLVMWGIRVFVKYIYEAEINSIVAPSAFIFSTISRSAFTTFTPINRLFTYLLSDETKPARTYGLFSSLWKLLAMLIPPFLVP